jgi:hypothetical protein
MQMVADYASESSFIVDADGVFCDALIETYPIQETRMPDTVMVHSCRACTFVPFPGRARNPRRTQTFTWLVRVVSVARKMPRYS